MSEPTDPECGSRWPVGHGHRAHVKRQRMTAASMGGAMGAKKALCKPRLALSETKLALLPGSTGSTGTKLSLPPGSAAHPVQNSPCRPARRPTRYKTLPARPKTLISAHFSRAGRTFYRFRHQQPEQGELYPACRAASGTKLSPLAASAGDTGTKLSQHTSSYRNSAKKFTQHPTSRADPRKSSPSTRLLGLTREKVRPAGHKTPFLGHLSCAGRTFSRSRPHRSEQGE